MSMLTETIEDARKEMDKTVEAFRHELARVRTGRASTALVENLQVNYYGSKTPLRQLAGLSAPEPRLIVITPYDKGAMHDIEKAIQTSDLGLTPMNDGKLIRIPIPELTEERRKDLVKVVRHKAEEGKVEVRNHRRHGRHELGELQKDGSLSTDELQRVEKDLEKITHEQVATIDRLLAQKEQELLQV